MHRTVKLLALCAFIVSSLGLPSHLFDNSALVVEPKHVRVVRSDKEASPIESDGTPKIYEMRIDSSISNRYAQTNVTSKVRNHGNESREAVFAVILPQKAFISRFVMEIDGKSYEAYVKEKEEAKQIYDQAIASGQSAAHVAASARDSNRFTVSVNIEPESKATFLLTYEQLLERMDNQYELVINIHPGQPVKDLQVNVAINESLPLKFVRAPQIRSGNEILQSNDELDPRAEINIINTTSAEVHFKPSIERQRELARSLKEKEDNGFSGQFVVQYDVERSKNGGEVLVDEGYFVHFLAPSDMQPLPKYVCFVLDTSGSMWGTKLIQLKEAMNKILKDLKPSDSFHIIDFNNWAKIRRLESSGIPANATDPPSYEANDDNIKRAIDIVQSFEASGGTNISGTLEYALQLANKEKESTDRQPMVIFLTDGDANIGLTSHDAIISMVSTVNTHKVPIFSLAFGRGADRALLEKLSLKNNGFARHIYVAADASLQLQDFYRYISSPIMSEVTFKYVSEASNLTKTRFPILFGGSELVVAGRMGEEATRRLEVVGYCYDGIIRLVPEVKRSVSKLERMWAYLTIQQLLEDKEAVKSQPEVKQKALDLALKYSFVTSVSSLVVVKPNSTSDVEPASATDQPHPTSGNWMQYRTGIRYSAARPVSAMSAHHMMAAAVPHSAYSSRDSYQSAPDILLSIRPGMPGMPSSRVPTTRKPAIPLSDLISKIPWLKDVLVDGAIQIDNGTYPLGLNETTTPDLLCPKVPRSPFPGYCSLLHECPQVFADLTDVQLFKEYQCSMRGLAAVCCPRSTRLSG